MYRYKCILSYDGTNYMGFQIQDDLPTIELELMKAIKKMLNVDVKIYPSGRTDRYVHAKGQVIHFDLDSNIPPKGIKSGLNSFLPSDIHIVSCETVNEDFHARFSAKSKEYHYIINTGEFDPLKSRYMPNITNLNYDLMAEAIKLYLGKHDFKGFASSSIDERKDTIKEIYEAKIIKTDDRLEFIFIGSSFLKYQIRKMMGILVEIGRGKETKEKINLIFETKDTRLSNKLLDGCGLYLYKVNY